MTTMAERFDRAASRYERWWAPVLAPSGRRLLDDLIGIVPGARRILDLGTGTGALALEALVRWPGAEVVGLDGSAGMLEVAEERAAARFDPSTRERLRLVSGLADRLPFPDEDFDLVVSSFVVQLVPDRGRALREVHRVLRPGGWCGYVTWLEAPDTFAPQAAFDEAIEELGLDEETVPETPARSGDVPSPAAAAAQLRRAGFRSVRVRADELEYRWDAASYLDFLEAYDEWECFESLPAAQRARLRAATAAKLRRLPPEAFVWRTPIVYAFGRKP
jgi:ubiquinone/menaquinone biosynthesis C-methylase UbiE